ncbi:MAG TPA: hypothetical protein VK133_01610 [Amoebophilaceae bacterium]|jgi:hypothetical protein|nr:hypothetical protein [Amoebophilaceae bacterium]
MSKTQYNTIPYLIQDAGSHLVRIALAPLKKGVHSNRKRAGKEERGNRIYL